MRAEEGVSRLYLLLSLSVVSTASTLVHKLTLVNGSCWHTSAIMNTRFFEIKIQIRGLSFDNPPSPVVVEFVSSSKVDDSLNNDNLQVLTVTVNDVEEAPAEVTWQYLLARAGLSESDLADRAGIGLRIIQDWKKRRKMPRLDSATAVADALGATLDEIASCMGLERKG